MSSYEYDAVFWDVGGVILDIETIAAAQRAFIERAVEAYGIEYDEETALSIWQDAMREYFRGREGLEYRTAREARNRGATALFDGDPPDDWRQLHEETTLERVQANPGAVETITALGEAGIYQAVVSDADAGGIPDTLRRFGIEEYVSHVTTSEEVGYVKPHEQMFETALRRADIDPARGVMIGDKYENDMEGAKRAGLATVAYGAEDGPAVDYRITDLRELLDVVGVDRE